MASFKIDSEIVDYAIASNSEDPSVGLESAKRPRTLHGSTYKIKTVGASYYVTINSIEHNGKIVPYEVFINSRESKHYSWALALSRMISATLRKGGDYSFIAEELSLIADPAGGVWQKGKYFPSLIAQIGEVLEEEFSKINGEEAPPQEAEESVTPLDTLEQCPSCGARAIVIENGCKVCKACGDSSCG